MSHTYKIPTKYRNQHGVSLMLSVLILSAITAIVFSLTTIIFVEIRTSGDTLRTEPPLYATLGVTEEALFQYKRFTPTGSKDNLDVSNCEPSANNVCSFLGGKLIINSGSLLALDDNPKVDFIYTGAVNNYAMYTLNDFTKQYGKVEVKVLDNGSNSTVGVQIVQTAIDGTVTLDGPYNIDKNSNFSYTNFSTNNQYDLKISQTAGTGNALVSITTYAADGTTLKGLPFVGQQVLKIVANYLGLTRSYTVRIPIP